MPIDLKQLATRLGLSTTTVSRALNGYSDVSEATRERVVTAARDMGYQPNPTARRLARGRADAVGIIYPLESAHLGDPQFVGVLEGISERLESDNFDLVLAASRPESEMRTFERMVSGGRIDGIIVARTRVVDPRIEYLLKTRVPFVAYGRSGDPSRYAWFDFDNEAGTALAVQEVVRLGHRRVAYVQSSTQLNFAAQRRAGFDRGMAEAGLAPPRDALIEGGVSRRSGYAAGQAVLARAERPSAVIVDNNLCGVGFVRALIDAGVTIGQEMSVVVYDGIPEDTLLLDLSIARIEQPTARETGMKLADMLLSLVNGHRPTPHQVLRQPVFVAGNSLGPAPASAA